MFDFLNIRNFSAEIDVVVTEMQLMDIHVSIDTILIPNRQVNYYWVQ